MRRAAFSPISVRLVRQALRDYALVVTGRRALELASYVRERGPRNKTRIAVTDFGSRVVDAIQLLVEHTQPSGVDHWRQRQANHIPHGPTSC